MEKSIYIRIQPEQPLFCSFIDGTIEKKIVAAAHQFHGGGWNGLVFVKDAPVHLPWACAFKFIYIVGAVATDTPLKCLLVGTFLEFQRDASEFWKFHSWMDVFFTLILANSGKINYKKLVVLYTLYIYYMVNDGTAKAPEISNLLIIKNIGTTNSV